MWKGKQLYGGRRHSSIGRLPSGALRGRADARPIRELIEQPDGRIKASLGMAKGVIIAAIMATAPNSRLALPARPPFSGAKRLKVSLSFLGHVCSLPLSLKPFLPAQSSLSVGLCVVSWLCVCVCVGTAFRLAREDSLASEPVAWLDASSRPARPGARERV